MESFDSIGKLSILASEPYQLGHWNASAYNLSAWRRAVNLSKNQWYVGHALACHMNSVRVSLSVIPLFEDEQSQAPRN